MLARIASPPGFAAVDEWLRPRLWATAWSTGFAGPGLSPNTVRLQLRHIDRLYTFCDDAFGADSLDEAISTGDAMATQLFLDAFFLELTSNPKYTTTHVQCWASTCSFIGVIALRRAIHEDAWMSLAGYLRAMRRIRRPTHSRFKFIRALPDVTLAALLNVADPHAEVNPFDSVAARLRAWLVLHLLLLCGLRRGELLLLSLDSLKHDVDATTGRLVYWLNVTTTGDEADTRSTRPSIKTLSHVWPGTADVHYGWPQLECGSRANELMTLLTPLPFERDGVSRPRRRASQMALSYSQGCEVCGKSSWGAKRIGDARLWRTIEVKASAAWGGGRGGGGFGFPYQWWWSDCAPRAGRPNGRKGRAVSEGGLPADAPGGRA